MNCPIFGEMQTMFKDKGSKTIKSKPTVEVKIITTLVNMVDVNVTIQNKTSEEQEFKDRKPGKTNWELIGKLKRS
jgi:hypothetical protein